ncbi:MAG: 3-isopropylmalate dehydratase small subunit [Alphaproteobacteria bacterium]
MEKFTTLAGIVAPLPFINVDTDMIIPKQFLKTIERTGLGAHLFHDLRYADAGAEKEDFVLNREPYRTAKILVTGENFGCGSSREHAPWALLDFGIRCVIAPSFAEIFYNNCFKNGILPIALPEPQADRIMAYAKENAGAALTVDLERQEIAAPEGAPAPFEAIRFEIDPFRKHCLLNGLDDIALTLEKAEAIDDFEEKQRLAQPWLWR